jgi:hypothetical protein
MKLLKELTDPVALQVLTDALRERGISHRVDGEGMRALLPLSGLTDARVMVDDDDMAAAQLVLRDLELEVDDD